MRGIEGSRVVSHSSSILGVECTNKDQVNPRICVFVNSDPLHLLMQKKKKFDD